jgi:hypothetical protein
MMSTKQLAFAVVIVIAAIVAYAGIADQDTRGMSDALSHSSPGAGALR